MTTNVNAPGDSLSLEQFLAAAVTNGSVANLRYPDGTIAQYVQAAINAGTANVPGAPRLEVAQMMRAILGA